MACKMQLFPGIQECILVQNSQEPASARMKLGVGCYGASVTPILDAFSGILEPENPAKKEGLAVLPL